MNSELLKTLKELKTNPTAALDLYLQLFNAPFWVLVQQPVTTIESMRFLTYPRAGNVRELPAFTSRDSQVLTELASQVKDAEVLLFEGKQLWPRVLNVVKTKVCEVAVDPGDAHGIRLTREMILGMVNKYESKADEQSHSHE